MRIKYCTSSKHLRLHFPQFISLASHVFLLMNSYLVESECAYVQQYVRAGLAETHMVVLAAIIRDLDRETAKSDSGKLLFSWPAAASFFCHVSN